MHLHTYILSVYCYTRCRDGL